MKNRGRTPLKLDDLASLTDQFAALTARSSPTTLLLFNLRRGDVQDEVALVVREADVARMSKRTA